MNVGGLRKVKRAYYVQIENETARDTTISYRALGVLTEILTHDEGWIVRADDLGRRRAEGRQAIEKALRELRAAGYYRVERRRGPDGRWKTGGAVSDYCIPEWAADHARSPRGVKVAVLADGSVVDVDETPRPDDSAPEVPNPGFQVSVTETGFSGSGEPPSGNPVSLEDHPEDHPVSSAARSAATADDVEPPQQQEPDVPREDTNAAAATPSAHDTRPDAPRAQRPADILADAGIDAAASSAFLSWLRVERGARNPGGLVVSENRSGTLSTLVEAWRQHNGISSGADRPTVGDSPWCGQCDRNTRTLIVSDDGREKVRRCSDCHPAAGKATSSAAAAIADERQTIANAKAGLEAVRAVRAQLPTGTSRRTTTRKAS